MYYIVSINVLILMYYINNDVALHVTYYVNFLIHCS